MAYYIKTAKGEEYTWYINQNKPILKQAPYVITDPLTGDLIFQSDIEIFQADGDELEAIVRYVKGVPYTWGSCR